MPYNSLVGVYLQKERKRNRKGQYVNIGTAKSNRMINSARVLAFMLTPLVVSAILGFIGAHYGNYDKHVYAFEYEKVEAGESAKPVVTTTSTPEFYSLRAEQCAKKHPDVYEKIKEYFPETYRSAAELYCRESSFNKLAINPSSGACGLTQSLPCKKMGCSLEDLGCQLTWGKAYIDNRYGSPVNAVGFHDDNNWY